jgi:2-polyprenyl-3-methyl-5-hydroxy-6-metoxy-1,4-benzoquinol methylase/ribosomal protein S27E
LKYSAKIKEEEIRPAHLVEANNQCLQNDIRRLINYKKDFINVPCPACGSIESVFQFSKYELDYTKCNNCDTVYINPRPTPQILDYYYKESENYTYWNKYIFPASESNRREKIIKPRVDRILHICGEHNVGRDCLLEVGAGFGTFCEEMSTRNHFNRIIAVEPTPDLADTCRSKGLEVVELPIEKVSLDGLIVDIVVSFEVIEHLFSPHKFLSACESILPSGGFIIITCPNYKGFDIMTLREISNSVDHEHLNYFNPNSLSIILNDCGFQVIEVLTPGRLDAELVRKKVLEGEYDISNQPLLNEILINRWDDIGDSFQQFLSDNLLSSHMWVVARKK